MSERAPRPLEANWSLCDACEQPFEQTRKDKRYCSKACARKATRNASRESRMCENKRRNEWHFGRAAWLLYDINRIPAHERDRAILQVLEAASGHDAALRNILTDPELLGAPTGSMVGKLKIDRRSPNIAKLVNSFCWQNYGASIKYVLLDNNEPAHRIFAGDKLPEREAKVPPHIYENTQEVHQRITLMGLKTLMTPKVEHAT